MKGAERTTYGKIIQIFVLTILGGLLTEKVHSASETDWDGNKHLT